MKVLVTVGTTQFDQLIQLIDSPEFAQIALRKSVQLLTVQIGRGTFVPKPIDNIPTSVIKFTDDMEKLLDSHDLIICHTGAGTILQCLCKGKQILTVINESLQGNHQSQLFEEVIKLQSVKGCKVKDFIRVFQSLEAGKGSGAREREIKGEHILQRVWDQLFDD